MSTAEAIGPELIGYTSRFSVAPGERLSFMVSADVERADARLVRLIHGDERSAIGLVEREVASSLDGAWTLERQLVHPGSFGVVETDAVVSAAGAHQLSGHVFVCPTLTERRSPQGVLAHVGADGAPWWDVAVEPRGDLVVRGYDAAGASASARLPGALSDGVWHSVSFTVDRAHGRAEVWSTPLSGLAAGLTSHADADIPAVSGAVGKGRLLLAARRLLGRAGEPRAVDTFNGKLERPTLFVGRLDADGARQLAAGNDPGRLPAAVVLDLDLGAGSEGWGLHSHAAGAPVGRLYNAPLRRCTSHAWRGETTTPTLAPDSYAAIAFHDDDVHHADWRPTHDWVVPEGLASGLYALRLRGGGAEDRIPFIVRPPRDRPTQAVALWLPTFTYAAYANARECQAGTPYGDFHPERSPGDEQLARHPEWGSSTYDVHPDGTGVVFSSLARPVPNVRPTYRAGLVNGPRHLAADLYLVHWLERASVPVDVFGDEDVHAEGSELLGRYATVITGSHPEYVTSRELDAVEEYADSGGRLMYMGGNGFYWITTVAPEAATTVEVRRGHAGTRAWDATPGEQHHQFTGELGGLWRHRGRPPHALAGIGFVAEGRDGHNRPYQRAPDSFTPQGVWAFEGIAADELIGADGLVMAGAAGDELDSANRALGTPPQTLVLASSSGQSDAYWLVVEDMLWNSDNLSGTKDRRICADITLTPKRNGGAVFAVGSMSWAGCLSHGDYDNPLARLSENVLLAFRSGSSPWLGSAAVDARSAR